MAGVLALAVAVSGTAHGRAAGEGRGTRDLTGQLLVAAPGMRDPRFTRTVILVVRHDASGALGLVVNRPVAAVPLAQVLGGLGLEHERISGSIRVHYGGPVEPGRVFVLHTADYRTDETRVIADGIALTAPSLVLPAIGAGAGPRRALLALGYSGWAGGQLEAELRAGAWIAAPADAALVFDEDYDATWRRLMTRRERETIEL